MQTVFVIRCKRCDLGSPRVFGAANRTTLSWSTLLKLTPQIGVAWCHRRLESERCVWNFGSPYSTSTVMIHFAVPGHSTAWNSRDSGHNSSVQQTSGMCTYWCLVQYVERLRTEHKTSNPAHKDGTVYWVMVEGNCLGDLWLSQPPQVHCTWYTLLW